MTMICTRLHQTARELVFSDMSRKMASACSRAKESISRALVSNKAFRATHLALKLLLAPDVGHLLIQVGNFRCEVR